MKQDFLEEARLSYRSKDSQRKKYFIEKLRAAQDAYLQIGNRLQRQAQEFIADAHGLGALIEMAQAEGKESEPHGNLIDTRDPDAK